MYFCVCVCPDVCMHITHFSSWHRFIYTLLLILVPYICLIFWQILVSNFFKMQSISWKLLGRSHRSQCSKCTYFIIQWKVKSKNRIGWNLNSQGTWSQNGANISSGVLINLLIRCFTLLSIDIRPAVFGDEICRLHRSPLNSKYSFNSLQNDKTPSQSR